MALEVGAGPPRVTPGHFLLRAEAVGGLRGSGGPVRDWSRGHTNVEGTMCPVLPAQEGVARR